jgi:hypothetical protein
VGLSSWIRYVDVTFAVGLAACIPYKRTMAVMRFLSTFVNSYKNNRLQLEMNPIVLGPADSIFMRTNGRTWGIKT